MEQAVGFCNQRQSGNKGPKIDPCGTPSDNLMYHRGRVQGTLERAQNNIQQIKHQLVKIRV